MFKIAKGFFKKVAYKVLDLDDTVKPIEHLELFEDYLDKFHFDTETNNINEFLDVLKKKHLVDDIVISTMDGSSIASTNGDSVSRAVTGAALYSYIQAELPKSDSILVKSNNHWNIFFSHNSKLYILKASSDLSIIEMRALAKEIDSFIAKGNFN